MTDNTSDTPNGVDAGLAEPSMEDILASIRRIIAEDDVAEQNHLDVDAVIMPAAPAIVSTPEPEIVETVTPANQIDAIAEQNDVEDILVLDQLVSDVGLEAKNLTEIDTEELIIGATEAEEFNPVSSVVSDLEDRLSTKSTEIELGNDDDGGDVVFSVDSEESAPNLASMTDDDALQAILDEEIDAVEPSDLTEELSLEAILDTSSEEIDLGAPLPDPVDPIDLDIDAESDLDIVKSLMADLADTSFLDENEGVDQIALSEDADLTDDLVDSLSVDEPDLDPVIAEDLGQDILSETSAAMDESFDLVMADETLAETDDEQDQILNDILELAIQDEEEAVGGLDLSVDEEALSLEVETEVASGSDNSLLKIAEKAEADADAMDGSNVAVAGLGAAAVAATAGLVGGDKDSNERIEMELPDEETASTEDLLNELDLALAEVTQDDNQKEAEKTPETEHELVVDTPEVEAATETEVETEDLFVESQETEEMARTARKDTLIDEVTEEASSDAFAELSKAVDEKAVFTESGPRVGDIVQDALRPMLKEWLDANLKGIVERAVAKEVKRISSGK